MARPGNLLAIDDKGTFIAVSAIEEIVNPDPHVPLGTSVIDFASNFANPPSRFIFSQSGVHIRPNSIELDRYRYNPSTVLRVAWSSFDPTLLVVLLSDGTLVAPHWTDSTAAEPPDQPFTNPITFSPGPRSATLPSMQFGVIVAHDTTKLTLLQSFVRRKVALPDPIFTALNSDCNDRLAPMTKLENGFHVVTGLMGKGLPIQRFPIESGITTPITTFEWADHRLFLYLTSHQIIQLTIPEFPNLLETGRPLTAQLIRQFDLPDFRGFFLTTSFAVIGTIRRVLIWNRGANDEQPSVENVGDVCGLAEERRSKKLVCLTRDGRVRGRPAEETVVGDLKGVLEQELDERLGRLERRGEELAARSAGIRPRVEEALKRIGARDRSQDERVAELLRKSQELLGKLRELQGCPQGENS
jgi:hypothetical protein